ncbi:MAG: UvrD-helicase domain-containing protein [Bacteroidia bacterium]|nr:UvrD-helicase domain-containing protein [Bacteroidia bacterium]
MNSYLDDLNDAQCEAVKATEGPSLVIAGAGSGKTRVLTYRIAHLINNGVKAHAILALTFTNKAARDMKERIISIVGPAVSKNLWMGTFHSKFATILRIESSKIGYPSNFSIYDTADSKSLIKQIIEDMKLDPQLYKVSEVLGRISSAKNNLVTPEVYANDPQYIERDRMAKRTELAEIYRQYTRRCFNSGAMDFDDLLLNTNILFRDNPGVLEKYQSKFRYILVDEYQDTNFSQYLIIKKLAANHQNICVVGDDAQSIYSFRGAKIENILNFKVDYPGYQLFKLEQNYRSTQNIVNAANSIIAHNKNQIHKKVFSKKQVGSKIRVIKANTDSEEAYIVSNQILDTQLQKCCNFNEFAILYRINAQSRTFEEACRKRNIPYKIYGGISFYQRKEIKDLIAYFRLVVNNKDEESFRRVINYPARGIGKTTLSRLDAYAYENDINIWEIISNPEIHNLGFNTGTNSRLQGFVKLISEFSAQLNETDAFEVATQIATMTGILMELHNDKSPESLSKFENIRELLNGIKEFTLSVEEPEKSTLGKYLENIALLTDFDTETDDDKDKVSLMTIHSAKGLEFKNVFIVGVEENLFPSSMSVGSQHELEEERRLFYVALTRAMEDVVITYTRSRFQWGSQLNCTPSRFIDEIDDQYVELPKEEDNIRINENLPRSFERERLKYSSLSKNKFEQAQKPFSPAMVPPGPEGKFVSVKKSKKVIMTGSGHDSKGQEIKAGMKVAHEKFGVGEVLNIEGVHPDEKALIFFFNTGQKQLLLRYAKLTIVG